MPDTETSALSPVAGSSMADASKTCSLPRAAPLPKPFCLPQISPDYDSPFVRGYNDVLAEVGISSDEWLKFVDSLNIAMAGFPPLVVVDVAGKVMGFVPVHFFQLISFGVQVAVGVAQHAATKSMANRVIHRANKKIFNPRGLVVRICTTGAVRAIGQGTMVRLRGKEAMKAIKGALKASAEEVGLIFGVGKNSAKRPVDPDMSFVDRQITSLSPYILPVSTDIAPAKKLRKSDILNKMAIIGNNMRQGKTRKVQKQVDRQRRLLAIAEGRQDGLPARPAPSTTATTVTQPSRESRSEKRDRRAIEKAMKAREDTKKLEKMQGRVRQLDRIDELKGNRLLWIVLMNSEQDRVLRGSRGNHEKSSPIEEHDNEELPGLVQEASKREEVKEIL